MSDSLLAALIAAATTLGVHLSMRFSDVLRHRWRTSVEAKRTDAEIGAQLRDELYAQVQALRAEVASLQEANIELRLANERLRTANAALSAEMAALTEEVARLRALLEAGGAGPAM